MARKRHKPEEIVAKLRQVDVLTAQGQSIAEAVKTIAVTETRYFRWRAEYGGMKSVRAPQCVPPGGSERGRNAGFSGLPGLRKSEMAGSSPATKIASFATIRTLPSRMLM